MQLTHQWASTSPEPLQPCLCPPAGQFQLQDNSGPSPTHQQGNTSLETPWIPQPAILGSSPSHKGANTSFGTPWNPQPAVSGTGPTHQSAVTRCGNPGPTITHPRTWLCPLLNQNQPWQPLEFHSKSPCIPCILPPHPQPVVNHFHTNQGLATKQTECQSHLPDCLWQPASTTGRPRQPTHGAPLEYMALGTRGGCNPGTPSMCLTKDHFSNVGKCIQSTRYVEIISRKNIFQIKEQARTPEEELGKVDLLNKSSR